MLDGLKAALEGTNLNFALFSWSHAPSGDYGVISLNDQAELSADTDAGSEKMLEGFVDYFARNDALTAKESIETALRGLGIWWSLNSVQYEEDTGYIHYEWMWRDTIGVATGVFYIVTFYANGNEIAPAQIVADLSEINYPSVDDYVDDGLLYSFVTWNENEQGRNIRFDAVFNVNVSITKSGSSYFANNDGNDFTELQVQTIIDWYDNGNSVRCVQGTYSILAENVSNDGVLFRPRLFLHNVLATWVVS